MLHHSNSMPVEEGFMRRSDLMEKPGVRELSELIKARNIEQLMRRSIAEEEKNEEIQAAFEDREREFERQAEQLRRSLDRQTQEGAGRGLGEAVQGDGREGVDSALKPKQAKKRRASLGVMRAVVGRKFLDKLQDEIEKEANLKYFRIFPFVENVKGKRFDNKVFNFLPLFGPQRSLRKEGQGLYYDQSLAAEDCLVRFENNTPGCNLWKVYSTNFSHFDVLIQHETNHHKKNTSFRFGLSFLRYSSHPVTFCVKNLDLERPDASTLSVWLSNLDEQTSEPIKARVEGDSLTFSLSPSPKFSKSLSVSLSPFFNVQTRLFAKAPRSTPQNIENRPPRPIRRPSASRSAPEAPYAKQKRSDKFLRQVIAQTAPSVPETLQGKNGSTGCGDLLGVSHRRVCGADLR